jgi:hypothetical protein
MSIEEVHKVILFYLNKEQNGFVTHEEIDRELDRAQMAYFSELYANPKTKTQTGSVAPPTYGNNQRIDDALSPFKETFQFASNGSPNPNPNGIITLPEGYMHLIGLYTTQYSSSLGRNVYSSVQVVNEWELIERLESQVIPVSLEDPIAIMSKERKIQLYPIQAQNGVVHYLRRPLAPSYDAQVEGRVVTMGNDAQDLEWGEADINNIIFKALSKFGLNLSSADIAQFGELKNQQGQ